MVRINDILTRMLPVVGHGGYGLTYLDEANGESLSGIMFDQFYEYSSADTLRDLVSDANMSYEDLNAKIVNQKKASLINLFNDVFKDRKLESGKLFKFPNYKNDPKAIESGKFSGYKVSLYANPKTSVVINSVILDIDTNQSIVLKLWDSFNEIKSVTLSGLTGTRTFDLDWLLSSDVSTEYYIGVLSLTGNYYNRNYDKANIRTCFTVANFEPCKVDATSISNFDAKEVVFVPETFGLNFDVSIVEDYTNIISRNRLDFAPSIALRFAIDMANLIIQSDRSNIREKYARVRSKEDLIGTIDQNGRVLSQGLNGRYENEVRRLKDKYVKYPKISI